MKLKSIHYNQNLSKKNVNPWIMEELLLSDLNLIVGKNATGKSRIINVIYHFANLIQNPRSFISGEWIVNYESESGPVKYSVSWDDNKVVNEFISVNGKEKLKRTSSKTEIYSESTNIWLTISPPPDRLVIHVRRDKTEFPFIEPIIKWASGVRGFSFSNTSPNLIAIPDNHSNLISLNNVTTKLEKLSENELKNVLIKLKEVGYNLENVSTKLIPGFPPNTKMICFKENEISNTLQQFEISQGMFRAFSLLTIIESLNSDDYISMILIDDFGEGLDFERASNLAKVIFDQSQTTYQIVATSNDSALINSVSLEELTVCYRKGSNVKCLNYSNSKEKFDYWKQLGLNNFDLFSTNFLLNS